jgi:L-2-hydroxyglutarate oxidase LhgO
VVGAGLVGLATARTVLRRRPGASVVVLEKEPQIASHQSGHNSGVIHSGIYYQPGSLKARLCVRGAALLRDFCDQDAIPHPERGKLIVAVRDEELGRLAELERRGVANGVEGLRRLEGSQIAQVEPSATGMRALYSPRTAIVDFGLVARAIAAEVTAAAGTILTDWPVTGLRRRAGLWEVESHGKAIRTRRVVTCAGLQSDRLAAMTGGDHSIRIVPFRGEYWRLTEPAASAIKGLIYPVPDPAFPFLGVHFTRRIADGAVWLGPNAVLAFAREGYRFASVRPRELAGTLRYGGFWAMARKYWRTGAYEM